MYVTSGPFQRTELRFVFVHEHMHTCMNIHIKLMSSHSVTSSSDNFLIVKFVKSQKN